MPTNNLGYVQYPDHNETVTALFLFYPSFGGHYGYLYH
jgi:hypothetical protein